MTTAAAVRACLFALGDETFAVDVRLAREVVTFEEITPVPLAPPHVLGVANLRGDVVPVVDARPLLGLPARPDARRRRALVLVGDGVQVALEVDAALGLDTFETVTPLADGVRARTGPWTRGLLRRDDRVATWLDADRLVAALRPAAGGSPPEV
ncbi:MAG TPA: chemotaxis protein CheW [Calidithermus sp.]|jgi:purine-binding chemotaxis protein CheW|nr:chemotaxis protein CheW [Calidithermus sp.]